MMQSGSAKTRIAAGHGSFPRFQRRPINYGSLVGELRVESGATIAGSPAARAVAFQHSSFDMVYWISFAAGYIGLAAGFALVGAAFIWQIP